MKMNKKVLSIFVISILALGLGAAAIVDYLSNTIDGKVVIESPLTLGMNTDNGNSYVSSIDFANTYGGNTITVYTKLTNNADVAINDKAVSFIIKSNNGDLFNGSEFTIKAYDTKTNLSAGAVECAPSVGKTQLICTTGVVTLASKTTQEIMFNITANAAIKPDTYTFNAKVLA